MSSQQFPRSGAPPAGLGPAPPPIPTSGSAGLIAPAATGKRAPQGTRLPRAAAGSGAGSEPGVPAPSAPGGVRGRGRTGRWAGGAGRPRGRVAAVPKAVSVANGKNNAKIALVAGSEKRRQGRAVPWLL